VRLTFPDEGETMRQLRAGVLIVSLLFMLACAKDPHNLKITEQNKNNFMDSIKESKQFTVDEVRLLLAYQMRGAAGQAFGRSQQSMVGKTVGDLINEEHRFEEGARKEAESQERLAAEAKAKEEAVAAELRKAVDLSVYQKSYQPADMDAGTYEDYIVIKCAYENTSGKDIRAFRGKLRFTDLFGSEIYESGLTISDPIKAKAKATWTGSIKYNQFIDKDVKLKNTDLKDMRAEWLPQSVIFADGSKIGQE
jgi:hypothetical protein